MKGLHTVIYLLCVIVFEIPVLGQASPGDIVTLAGGGGLSTSLNLPKSVVVDNAGNFFIADSNNNRIRKVYADTGITTTVAGSNNGAKGYSGDNGYAGSALLSGPAGVALDNAGNLYIADQGNNRIRKVSANTGNITTVAGNGIAGYSGDYDAATAAQLNLPAGVAVDSAGNLYIADENNNRIRMVNTNGYITTVAGNGTKGYSGDNNAATAAQLNQPTGVAVDSNGNLYIADWGNQRIRKVSNNSGITTVVGNGTHGYSGDNGLATTAELAGPTGVTVDNNGNLYIADRDNNRIRKVFASTGVITTVAGNGNADFSGDNSPAIAAGLSGPDGVSVDSSGNLYIADRINNRIRKVIENNIPVLIVTNPTNNSKTAQPLETINGTVSETSTVAVTVNNGTPQNAYITGSAYSVTVNLTGGINTITISATDLAGNTSNSALTVTYDNTDPSVTITAPNQDITTSENSLIIRGMVSDTFTSATVTVTFNNQIYTPTINNGNFSQLIIVPTEGTYAVTATATDEAGNSSSVTRNIIYIMPVNGICGLSNNGTFIIVPNTNLCSAGVASGVTGSGPWSWNCTSNNGGTDSNCSANIQTYPLNLTLIGSGQVSGNISCISGSSCQQQQLNAGTTATIIATTTIDTTFGGWTGCTATNGNSCSCIMDTGKNVTATFVTAPVAIIQRNGSKFELLQSAYDAAANNDIIKARVSTMPLIGSLNINRMNVEVLIKGGYDADFGSVQSSYTAMQDSLIVKYGSIVVDRLIIK